MNVNGRHCSSTPIFLVCINSMHMSPCRSDYRSVRSFARLISLWRIQRGLLSFDAFLLEKMAELVGGILASPIST